MHFAFHFIKMLKVKRLMRFLVGARYFTIQGPEPLVSISKNTFGKDLYDSLVNAQSLPIALKDAVTEETVSYQTLLNKSCRLAASLKEMGVTSNNTIGVLSENNVHYFYPILAAMYSGIIATPFSSNSTPRELIHYCNISNPKVLFCSKSMLKVLKEAAPHLKCVEKIIVTDSDKTISDIETIDNVLTQSTINQPEAFNPRYTTALIMYSSGTTGLPKGVSMTHTNINANCSILRNPSILRQTDPGSSYALANLPFSHAYGMTWALYNILAGTSLVIMNKFDPATFLKSIQDYKFNTLTLVPPLIQFLAMHPMVDRYDLSSVDDIISGATPLRPEVELAIRKRLNLKYVRQGLGMTEGVILLMTTFHESKQGSCGKVAPHVAAKVVDIDTRKDLSCNQQGELLFKGDSIMLGYYNDDEVTRKTLTEDGWLCTGDIGYYDQDGFFYVVDRLKELIKYKGFQVPPAELEALLATHPKIKEACVVGVPDERAGELPMAFVVKQPNEDLNEKEVISFVEGKVANEKQLRGGVRFIEEIPKSPIGKILRKNLRALVCNP